MRKFYRRPTQKLYPVVRSDDLSQTAMGRSRSCRHSSRSPGQVGIYVL